MKKSWEELLRERIDEKLHHMLAKAEWNRKEFTVEDVMLLYLAMAVKLKKDSGRGSGGVSDPDMRSLLEDLKQLNDLHASGYQEIKRRLSTGGSGG